MGGPTLDLPCRRAKAPALPGRSNVVTAGLDPSASARRKRRGGALSCQGENRVDTGTSEEPRRVVAPLKRLDPVPGLLGERRLDRAVQPPGREPRPGGQPVDQALAILLRQARFRLARPLDRRLEPALEVFPHRLAIQPGLPRDRADAEALPFQFQDHHDLPQFHHLRALPLASAGIILRRRWSGGHAPRTIGNSAKLGKFYPALLERFRPALTPRSPRR